MRLSRRRQPTWRTYRKARTWVALRLPLLAGLALLGALVPAHAGFARAQVSANVTVVATGLNSPRGLTFGPDGNLYVAEGGIGGISTTVGLCPQVPEVGPYSGGFTARISRINPADGSRTTVVDGLPSSQTTAASGGFVSGVADVAFIGRTLYALIAGAGCSHGLAGTSNAILRVNGDGTTTQIADLSQFVMTHPVQFPDPADFEPDGTWYSMVALDGSLYTVEPNHQELDRIGLDGSIRRVLDFSTIWPGPTEWHGPTALATYLGQFLVGYLTPFPEVVGASNISLVTRGGFLRVVATGLTAVLGVAVHAGRLYVLETGTVPGFPPQFAGTGAVVQVTATGPFTVASGLTNPTAMTFGLDGALYVSNNGFGSPAGTGQIVRINVASP